MRKNKTIRIPPTGMSGFETLTRRRFLAAAAAFAVNGVSIADAPATGMKLAFQVYGVRDLCERDFPGTLKAVHAIGYEGVETGRFYGFDAKGLGSVVRDAGLKLVALQLYPHNLTEPQLRETIRFCRECGCSRINVAWFKGSDVNPNDWQLLIHVLNHAAMVCAKEGIVVAYHNHDHEFQIRVQGKTVWEWLWEGTPGDSLRQVTATPRFSPLVLQELDCGNCVLGGGDPVYWLDRFPNRNPTVHVMPAIRDTAGLKPGGAGVGSVRDAARWREILAALRRNGTEWLVVKPTVFPGALDDLAASYAYLRPLLQTRSC